MSREKNSEQTKKKFFLTIFRLLIDPHRACMVYDELFVPSIQVNHTQYLLDIAVSFVGNDDSLLRLYDLTHLPKQEELACEGHPSYTHTQIEHSAYNYTNNAQYD